HAEVLGSRDGLVDGRVLRRRRGHHQHPALPQPHVVVERAHRRHDPLPRTRQLQRLVAAEQRHELGHRRPVAVDEAAVAATRPGATGDSLEQHDVGRRLAFLHGQSGPEPRVAAADDADVRRHVAGQRRLGLVRARLVPPPGRKAGLDGQAVAADRSRRICRRTLVSAAPTATTKIAVPMTLTCGGAPTRAAPQTKSGNVVSEPALKYVTTKSSIEIAKHRSSAAKMAGAISGNVTFRNVTHSFAPRSIAASSRWRSNPISRALTVTTAKLMQNITCAIRIVEKPNTTFRLRKRVSSDAPSTISGVDSGRKIRMFVPPRPRKLYRTRARAISVPSAVATRLASSAISS